MQWSLLKKVVSSVKMIGDYQHIAKLTLWSDGEAIGLIICAARMIIKKTVCS